MSIELERELIMRANKEFLEQLGLHSSKAGFSASLSNKVNTNSSRSLDTKKRATVTVGGPSLARRSARLGGLKPSGFYVLSESSSEIRFGGAAGTAPVAAGDVAAQDSSRLIPEVLTLDSTSTTDRDGAAFLTSLTALNPAAAPGDAVPPESMQIAAVVSGWGIDPGRGVAKVVPGRILSTAFHPSAAKVVAVAGDTDGHVGFWDVDTDADSGAPAVVQFRPHTNGVGALQFAPGDPMKLWSWSYDGRVTCMDAGRLEFRRMFAVDEADHGWVQHGCISEADPNSVYLSTSRGLVMAVDARSCGLDHRTPVWQFAAHGTKKCNTVHPCPTDGHLLATAGLDGAVRVWDTRRLGKAPAAVATFQYKRSINSAFFNPTGTHLLAVTQNNALCLYPRTSWAAAAAAAPDTEPSELPHDNQTGRFLSTFHGMWSPRAPHAFLVGSMQQPRCLEVYSAERRGVRIGVLRGGALASVCSRNCWHPSLDMVCGGNSSGRLHLFR
jgi:hypothetical protein